MAITFPTTLDTITNPVAGDGLNSPSHAGQHSDANDILEALEAKVGADSSAVTSSHDYKIATLETNNTGTNTGDEVVATGAEVNTGTDNVKMVTPKAVADSTLISNVVEDTTPELGGELDCGAHSIGFTQQTATGDGTTTIDWKLGNKMKFTFGAQNETFTFTAPTNPCNLLLMLVQDGTGSRTATFPATVKWAGGGTAPTLTTTASGIDIISLYFDGTNYYSVPSLDFS